jgi:hypothetical protein
MESSPALLGEFLENALDASVEADACAVERRECEHGTISIVPRDERVELSQEKPRQSSCLEVEVAAKLVGDSSVCVTVEQAGE